MVMGGAKWQPSEAQERVLSVFQDADYEIDVGKACAKADVPRRTFYHWPEHPEFVGWWHEQRQRFWAMRLGRLDAATWAGATQKDAPGGTADRKLLYERYDEAYQPRERKIVEGNLGLDFSKLTEGELKRFDDSVRDETPADGGAESEAPSDTVGKSAEGSA